MAQTAILQKQAVSRRSVGIAVFCLAVAVFCVLLAQGTAGETSTFVLTSLRAGVNIPAPDLVLPTAASIYVLGVLAGLSAGLLFTPGFKRGNWVIFLAVAVAISAFLVWATQGKSLNLTGMLVSSVVRAAPIAMAAVAAIYSERAGVVNLGIEGMMLVGAFSAVVFASITQSMWVGVIAGILTGVIFSGLHAILSIRYMVNQIISGTAILILALGLTSYLQRAVLNPNPELNQPGPTIAAFAIPGLWRIPVLGPVFFNQSPIIYAMILLVIITHLVLFYTRWGLRIRAVGEHPKAADTLGINVYTVRYIAVLISGGIAGLAGSYMSIGAAGRFNEGMTAGKGFLGIAAMIFGNWNPVGAFWGSLIFGFFDSWQEKLSLLQIGIPVDLLGMAPYIATMIVLAGVVGRSRMPAADGTPYKK